jgi:hypothetical protein
MNSSYEDRAGRGVMYYEEERKSDKHPEYKGYVMLEMDYKAGDKLKLSAWIRKTSKGYNLISLNEDTWARKKREEAASAGPREVKPAYGKGRGFDEDVPF